MGYRFKEKEVANVIIFQNNEGKKGIPYSYLRSVDLNRLEDEILIDYGMVIMVIRGKNLNELFEKVLSQQIHSISLCSIDCTISVISDLYILKNGKIKDPAGIEITDIQARLVE